MTNAKNLLETLRHITNEVNDVMLTDKILKIKLELDDLAKQMEEVVKEASGAADSVIEAPTPVISGHPVTEVAVTRTPSIPPSTPKAKKTPVVAIEKEEDAPKTEESTAKTVQTVRDSLAQIEKQLSNLEAKPSKYSRGTAA